MKKLLPVFLFLIGIAVLVGVYFLVIKGKGDESGVDDESSLVEVPLEERPLVSLTPSGDGHWLNMKVDKLVIDAESLDYELLYKLPDGRTQGVPGTVSLDEKQVIENDLLLGSESSGKFRYDEGVERGTFTLRFRNKKGKLVAKFSTEFSLQSGTAELSSVDGNFEYTLDEESDAFFVTMETVGIPDKTSPGIVSGPFGVFSSSGDDNPGKVKLDGGVITRWSGNEWEKLEDATANDIGIFITTSE